MRVQAQPAGNISSIKWSPRCTARYTGVSSSPILPSGVEVSKGRRIVTEGPEPVGRAYLSAVASASHPLCLLGRALPIDRFDAHEMSGDGKLGDQLAD